MALETVLSALTPRYRTVHTHLRGIIFPVGIGFTLIELLVVVSIIVVLLALLAPALDKATQAAENAACLADQHQANTGLMQYTQSNRQWFPYILGNTAYSVTVRSGGSNPGNWYDSRPKMQPYFSNRDVLYCVTNSAKTYPNRKTQDTFKSSGAGPAGWDVLPLDVPDDHYVYIDYAIFAGTSYLRVSFDVNYLLRPDEEIHEVPNFGTGTPRVPDRLSQSIPNAASSDVPLTADAVFSYLPTSLVAIQDGPFVHFDNATTTATWVKSHLDDQDIAGVNVTFMDGSGRWRSRRDIGPRLRHYVQASDYGYVYWY